MIKRMWVSEHALLIHAFHYLLNFLLKPELLLKGNLQALQRISMLNLLWNFALFYENQTFSMMLPHQHSNQLNSSIAPLLQDSLRDSGKTQCKGFSLIFPEILLSGIRVIRVQGFCSFNAVFYYFNQPCFSISPPI